MPGLAGPYGVALNSAGDLYIAASGNGRVRKVDTNGIITTVAGGGIAGDGGAATNASLITPRAAAADAFGHIYIADTGHNRIRKVDTNGIITTVAGGGSGGDGGRATNASLNTPCGLALDAAGNLYIADATDERVRKVDTDGIITTIAGNGNGAFSGDGGAAATASLDYPEGLAFDAVGNLYIADSSNNRIREVYLAGYPTLANTNVSASNAGNYAVVITNPYGSATSVVATLTVQGPPVVTLQPTNQTVLAGSSPVFSVAVAGWDHLGIGGTWT